ncbi:MAG: extracellular solute-binding protein [Bacillota bacterium]|nr:extracellular solute-binding protein [Bacillota bacterium]
MEKRRYRILQILGLCMLITLIVGCSSGSASKARLLKVVSESNGVYPIKTDVTLKYWMILHNNVAQVTDNFGNLPIAKELEKQTGIKVKYIHPPKGQEMEAFNIMVASGELPDIIEYNWLKYPGGPNNAIENSTILKLDNLIKNYAPNLYGYLEKHPDINKMVKTDDGHYYVFPFLRPDEDLLVTFGPVVRKDWLDDLHLKMPETLGDWYNMLTAFKDNKKCEAPLTATVKLDDDRNTVFSEVIKLFSGATDSYQDFYIENNKVKYGPIEENRRYFFYVMSKWYKEGLIDNNIAVNDNQVQEFNMLSGKSGATICSGGSGLGKWISALKRDNPKYDLTPVQYPSLVRGETPKFGARSLEYSGPGSAAISANSKNAKLAAQYLDYMYSKEGHMLINFGIENISYKMVNNQPVYTDLIMNSKEDLAPVTVMSKYIRGHTNGAFIQDERYLQQYYSLSQQKDALRLWEMTEQKKYRMLPVTPTVEESVDLSRMVNDINTYVNDMTYKFIMGKEPITKFDEYVNQVKSLGVDRVISIYQAALDRYYKR